MSPSYLDPVAISADVQKYLPVIDMVINLVPGASGSALVILLNRLLDPASVIAVVDAINQIDGAQPPSKASVRYPVSD
jgi:hypothetical protein